MSAVLISFRRADARSPEDDECLPIGSIDLAS